MLAVPDEAALLNLERTVAARDLCGVLVREPDLLEEATALALAPSAATSELLAQLPLAHGCGDEQAATSAQRRKRSLAERMGACAQAPGQNVLEHGASVREHYRALLDHLEGRVDLGGCGNWKLPTWLEEYGPQLLAAQAPYPLVDRYLSIHDCGKPAVLVVDVDGRRHFPDHSASSVRTYRRAYKEHASDQVADMIANDLRIHTLKADGVAEFAALPDAATHLLAGLAELTSNAAMFGGVDSTGFKIKFKALTSRGNAICRLLFDQSVALEGGAGR